MLITWDYLLVALSVLVALAGTFTALTHATRMRSSQGRSSSAWMAAGAVTLGLTIWAMHFVGMLALKLPVPASFDRKLTLLSALPSILSACLMFAVLRTPALTGRRIFLAALITTLGIGVMHHLGMHSLQINPPIHVSLSFEIIGGLLCLGLAWSALSAAFSSRTEVSTLPRVMGGAMLLGAAISVMHYTAMLGMSVPPQAHPLATASSIHAQLLGFSLGLVSLLWFGTGLLAAAFDRHIATLNHRVQALATARTDELRESEEKMRAVIDAALDCIITVDSDDHITHFNRAAEITFGYRSADVIGRSLAETIIPPSYRDKHLAGMRRFLESGDSRILGKRLELTAMRADGSEFPAELTVTRLNREGPPMMTGFLRDITDRKQAETEIHSLAYYDALTHLPNRRLMRDRLLQSLASAQRHGSHGAILFIDLDNFKTLNDTRGHDIGDLLLIEVAHRLRISVRNEDTIARLGGDEFVVLLEHLNPSPQQAAVEAELVGEKLCQSLSRPYMLGSIEYHCTSSIGMTLFNDATISVDELLKRADTAMYEAKRAGRNTLRFFDPEMQAALEYRSGLETDLRHAMERNELVLYFQPQVDQAYAVIGAEVLLRWLHPERGLVSPVEFIPIAEECGLIMPIGRWVIEAACQQLKQWESHPVARDMILAVNVSARQFRQANFVEEVEQILAQTGIRAGRLKLELTESLVLHDVEDSIEKMVRLVRLGIHFSLDDFGTGQSSLTYLKRLPLHQLKIDQSFVRDIAVDKNDAVIVRTIIGMADNLGLSVIAEGVETSEQLGYLQNYGCPAFQGYLFGKPMPCDKFVARLEEEVPETPLSDHFPHP